MTVGAFASRIQGRSVDAGRGFSFVWFSPYSVCLFMLLNFAETLGEREASLRVRPCVTTCRVYMAIGN
ncbi:hypothetical protein K504DRAFT_456968 [Pleomassaria siparia CBS 279.74]|uniref:Uncharacterized protein n=1 Tax=Pleomassaria siparia CBS 279.74 TaxID=1314801 RepID=A0A6G1KQE4_9PLEO|nr:hypothetical protein K504DRAFT_456968 [Pleomassaria siparia CBS 279.74]